MKPIAVRKVTPLDDVAVSRPPQRPTAALFGFKVAVTGSEAPGARVRLVVLSVRAPAGRAAAVSSTRVAPRSSVTEVLDELV